MVSDISFGLLNYSILVVYLLAMVGIGLLFARRQKSTEEFFLASRKMPWIVVAMSMFASVTSAVSYMGIPGTAYTENISLLLVGFISPVVAPFLIFIIYPFYRALNVTTSYEYIYRRFGAPARYTVSALFLLARIGWLGVVLYAPAMTLSVVAGINITIGIPLIGILATVCAVLGGLTAVLWTDVVQFILMIVGAVSIAVSLCLSVPGGFAGILEIAHRENHLQVIDWHPSLYTMSGFAVGLSYFLQLMQDYGTDQVAVQRLMSVKTSLGVARAIIFNSISDVVFMSLLLFVGLGLFAYYSNFPQELGDGIRGDRVLPFYIMHALPNGFSGLMITVIFAASIATMDSALNSMSTVIINDFIQPLRRQKYSDRHDVRLARWLTFSLGVFAVGVAFYVARIEQLIKATSSFIGLFAGPILALFLLGMLTQRAKFSGWVVGLSIAIPATVWVEHDTDVHFIYYFPFCFSVCAIFGYLASVLIGIVTDRPTSAERELTIWGRRKETATRHLDI